MISLPTLAKGLGTDILGISWALIAYQVAGIGLGVVCGRHWPAHVLHHPRAHFLCHPFLSPRGAKALADVYGDYLSRPIALACDR